MPRFMRIITLIFGKNINIYDTATKLTYSYKSLTLFDIEYAVLKGEK